MSRPAGRRGFGRQVATGRSPVCPFRADTVGPVSSLMNPVGPEESSTYWRRRAIVLVAMAVLLWLGWMAVGAAIGSSDADEAAAPAPTPTYGLSIAPSEEPADVADAEAGDAASPEATGAGEDADVDASPSPGGPCLDGDVEVAAETAGSSTEEGQGLGLTMTVTNTGTLSCTRDVGAGANELTISSGTTVVWSSDHCNPSDAVSDVLLEPGEPWSTAMTWPGIASASGCQADQALVTAGTYSFVARNGSVTSQPAPVVVQ